jgi:hypothetical protein
VPQQVGLLEEAALKTADGMSRLRTLQKLEDYWITINKIENRADAANAIASTISPRALTHALR